MQVLFLDSSRNDRNYFIKPVNESYLTFYTNALLT